jgi:SPP1 gp7 family putative phage head morphogenesis protein
MSYDLKSMARQRGIRRKVIPLRPIEPPRGMEAEYRRILVRMLNEIARHVREEMLPEIERERALLTTDAAGDRIEGLFGGLRRLVERLYGAAEQMTRRIFQAEATRHTDQFAATVRNAIGIDIAAVLRASPGLEERVSMAALRNAQNIKGLADDTTKRVAEAITRNLSQGGTAKTLSKELQEAFAFEQKRADFIARNEVANAVSNLNQFRQQEAGVTEYRFRTSQDERVRDDHRAMEGKICRWDDETVYFNESTEKWEPRSSIGGVELHPGLDYQCRCTGQAIIRLD